MSFREYYDSYWSRPEPPPCNDALTGKRANLAMRALNAASARRVLDVGSGAGGFVAELRSAGVDASGMDVSPRAVAIAHRDHPECNFIAHSAENPPWPFHDGSFDAVVAFEVIEHLLEPRKMLEGARRALRTGGHLGVTTPYHGLAKNVAIAMLAFERHFAVEGDHVRFFTDHALETLLRDTGFDVEHKTHYGRFGPLWSGVFVWAKKR